MKKINKLPIAFIIVCILAILIVPKSMSDYEIMVLNIGLIYAIASFGLSIILGMGGQLSFAGLSFMGVGAYVTGNLCSGRLGITVSPLLAILIGMAIAGIIAYILGLILFRLKGTYFTFATIAIVQVSWSFYQNYEPFFGGAGGIAGIPSLTLGSFEYNTPKSWFILLSILVTIVAMLVERIRSKQLGRSLASVRDNETAALTLGVDVYRTKTIAFTIAGVLGALAGGMYALNNGFISSDMFNFERSTLLIIITMIGGVNNSFGIVLGSILINVIPEAMRDFELVSRLLQLIYGILVIIMMVFMPMGIAGMFETLYKKLKFYLRKKKKEKLLYKAIN
jgi:branched-chain amino acid transport system permease protein